ncbi:MAG TPA: hypothetical protein VH969_05580 [Actinophytocola sp.]|jgi:hypothetical protein|uniref:hypothetical protein n=1 Tax=Actinophytocola sp. TaxID=1872138 RepID=UPI002F933BB2
MSAPTTTPPAVRNATLAVWAILALVVLRVILTIAMSDALLDAWIDSSEGRQALPRELAAETAPAYTGVAIVVLVICVVLALAAANLSKGARWARVLVYVFASLNIVGIVLSFLAPSLIVLMVINALVLLLSVGAIVLLSTGESNRFFAR